MPKILTLKISSLFSTSYYHPVLSKLALKGTPCQAKHSLRSIAKISAASSQPFDRVFTVSAVNNSTIKEGLPGVWGNKGTLAKYRWEQGNISQFLGTREQIRKITVRKHSERVWENGNIGQFWKGTREQRPPLGDPH